MKKITIIAVAALAVSFASCKKARTCTCTDSSSSTYQSVTTYEKMSSSTANVVCPKTRTSGGSVETCVLS